MARIINNTQPPSGTLYKVFLENNKQQDFMVVYAESAEDAMIDVSIVWKGTKWVVTKATREYFIYDHGDSINGNHIKKVWLTEEEYSELKKDEYAIFETYKEALDYENFY